MFSTSYFIALGVGAVIVALLLAALLPVTTALWSRLLPRLRAALSKSGKQTQMAAATGAEALQQLLDRLQCTNNLLSDPDSESETMVAFDFQGGHFIGAIDHDDDNPLSGTLSISYFSCLSAPLAESELLNRVVNEINLISLPPKATITPASESDEVDSSLNVNLHISGIRLIADDRGEAMLRALLTSCFHVQRVAADRMTELRRSDPDATMLNRLPSEKAAVAIARAEMQNAGSVWAGPWYEIPKWTLGEVVRRMYGKELAEDVSLFVDGKEVSEPDVMSYPIFDTLFDREGVAVGDIATIDLMTENISEQSLHLVLTMKSVSERMFLIRIEAVSAGLPVTPYRSIESAETLPGIRQATVGIYRGDPQQFRAEAEFMAQEEGLVQRCIDGNAAYSLYWGRVLFADGRLLEAEHYLRNAWTFISKRLLAEGDDPERELLQCYEDTAFYLGQLYYQLGRYTDSYYYLDLIVQNHRLLTTKQYVLTLQALGDPRLPRMLSNLREGVRAGKPGSDEEEADEAVDATVMELFEFIDRQEIIISIRRGELDKARESLQRILESNPDSEFALSWLKTISE